MLSVLLKIHIIVSVSIFIITYVIMTYKINSLPRMIRRAMNSTSVLSMDMVVKSFIPIFNLILLISAIAWDKSDLLR